jgi:hypothetical protein
MIPEQTLSTALGVLSAMITPAVLISACSSLILATSQRLARTMDRARQVATRLEELASTPADTVPWQEQRAMLFEQLRWTARRTRLLQQSMARLYLALSVFVATSVAIGLVMVTHVALAWVPIIFGLGGAGLLLHASLLLIQESRTQLTAVNQEMDFVVRTTEARLPADLRGRASAPTRRARLRMPYSARSR